MMKSPAGTKTIFFGAVLDAVADTSVDPAAKNNKTASRRNHGKTRDPSGEFGRVPMSFEV